MSRLCLTFLILSFFGNLIAQQNITISVDNTEPRVGQEFLLSVESDFFDSYLNKLLPDELNIRPGRVAQLTKDTYKTLMATKEGQMTIGPLEFNFNGLSYKSNIITINVIPGLGDKEGLWIRRITLDDGEYVLLEQILMAEKITTRSKKSTSISWETKDDQFAKLIVNTDFNGIEFRDSHSGTGGHPDKIRTHPTEIRYSYNYYRIIKSIDFKGELKLTREQFVNLPKSFELENISIK